MRQFNLLVAIGFFLGVAHAGEPTCIDVTVSVDAIPSKGKINVPVTSEEGTGYRILEGASEINKSFTLEQVEKLVFDETVEPEKVKDYVGAEAASKLMSAPLKEENGNEFHNLSGVDLEIGGEGMKATYDAIYPRTLGKLLQKLDPSIKAEKTKLLPYGQMRAPGIGVASDFHNDFTFFPLTETAKAKVLDEGQPMFALAPSGKKLAVLHNLSAENLMFADKMGGIAVPSLAVVKEGMGLGGGFGEITMIGHKELGDPTRNPIFDADAYTTRFPRPDYKPVPVSKAQKLVDKLKPFSKKFENNMGLGSIWDEMVNRPDPEKLTQTMVRSEGAQAAFLASQGITPEPIMRDALKGENYPWVQMPSFLEWLNANPEPDRGDEVWRKGLSEAASRAIGEYLRSPLATQSRAGILPDDLIEKLEETYRDQAMDDDGLLAFGPQDRIMRTVKLVGQQALDIGATRDLLDGLIKGRESDFKRWIDDNAISLFGEPRMKLRGKNVPYTIDNIVDAMTGKAVKSKEDTFTFGEGAARAAASTRFTDLEKMRRAADDGMAAEAEVEAERKSVQKLTEDWRMALLPSYAYRDYKGNVDVFDAMDASMRAFAKVAAKKKRTAADLRSALAREDFKQIPQGVLEQGLEAIDAFMRVPVPYFESKPQRAVSINEFAGAVIPDTSPPEVRDILDHHGVAYREYVRGNGEPETQSKAAADFARELSEQGEDTLFALKGFYSPAIRAAEKIKQDKATPDQWWSMISKTPGVRQEELQWMGLKLWLDGQGKSLPKRDVLDFMAQHQIELEDKILGGKDPNASGYDDDFDIDEYQEEIDERSEEIYDELRQERDDEAIAEWRRASTSARPYQLLLLDCRMPEMDGFQVA